MVPLRVVILSAALIFAGAGLAAAAADPDAPVSSPACDPGATGQSFECHLGVADEAAVAALGAQYAMLWLEGDQQGWVVGLAPGGLDEAAARAAIERELVVRLPADAATLLGRLRLAPQPYGLAELTAALDAVVAQLDGTGLLTSSYVGPDLAGDGIVRVRIGAWDEATPGEVPARVAAAVAPYGDRIVVSAEPPAIPEILQDGLPDGAVAKGERRRGVLRWVSLRSCARGKAVVRVRVRPARRAAVRSVGIAADRRHRIAGRRLGKALGVRVERADAVRVAVRLRDGRLVRGTFAVTGCS